MPPAPGQRGSAERRNARAIPGSRIQPARADRGHLLKRRVLHHEDRPVRRLAPMAFDRLEDLLDVQARHLGEHAPGALEILRVFPLD